MHAASLVGRKTEVASEVVKTVGTGKAAKKVKVSVKAPVGCGTLGLSCCASGGACSAGLSCNEKTCMPLPKSS